jgi:hypothetical protein
MTAPLMLGNRMSLLPASRFCPSAGRLSAAAGAGRSAAISKAWHARCSGAADAAQLLASLTDEEREQALAWPEPAPAFVVIDHDRKVRLLYSEAEHELEVALDEYGLAPSDFSEPLTVGHLDFAWTLEDIDSMRLAVVADLKRSRFTAQPDSLQLLAYGFAYAARVGATAFLTGCWYAEDAEWSFSGEWVVIGTPRANELLEQVLHAARNKGTDINFGPHCGSCYGWRLCPSHAVPNPPGLENIQDPTPEQAAQYLAHIAAQEKVLEAARTRLKMLTREGLRVETDDKVWREISAKGRETIDAAKAREMGVPLKVGKPSSQFRWVNK